MVKILQNSHLSADLFNNQVVHSDSALVLFLDFLEIPLELGRSNIKVRQRYLLHGVEVLPFLDLVDGAISPFAL